MQFVRIHTIRVFVAAIAVLTIVCGFSILAANDEQPVAETPSGESPSKSGEKPDVTPDAEGFYGVPDAVIDDPESARELLSLLRQANIRIALDDFGIGSSSIYHLKRLDLDKLKIDRSYVHTLGSDSKNDAIVRAILSSAMSSALPSRPKESRRPNNAAP